MSSANVAAMAETTPDATRLAAEARDRVRFEEEALALADQVLRVARHLAPSKDEAEDLVKRRPRAFRSWRSYTPGNEPAGVAAADPHEPQHRPWAA